MNRAHKVLADFYTLQYPPNGSADERAFSAMSIRSELSHRLAKDASGVPHLLVSVHFDANRHRGKNNYKFKNVGIEHGQDCTILFSNGQLTQQRYTIVSCLEPALSDVFVVFADLLALILGAAPDEETVTFQVIYLSQLLASETTPSKETVRGLWAELFLISQCSNPSLLVTAWHTEDNARSDFVLDMERIEVKSCGPRRRIHEFSLEQLSSMNVAEPLIASIMLEASGSGETVADLVNRILNDRSVSAAQGEKVVQNVSNLLGKTWLSSDQERFDLAVAKSSLRLYWASAIPQIQQPLPDFVSAVRFRAEIPDSLVSVSSLKAQSSHSIWLALLSLVS